MRSCKEPTRGDLVNLIVLNQSDSVFLKTTNLYTKILIFDKGSGLHANFDVGGRELGDHHS